MSSKKQLIIVVMNDIFKHNCFYFKPMENVYNMKMITTNTIKDTFLGMNDSLNVIFKRTYVYEDETHKETYCPFMTLSKDDDIILILDFVDNKDESRIICYKERAFKCCNIFRYYSLIISGKLYLWERPHEMLIEKSTFSINDDLIRFNKTEGKEMSIRDLVNIVLNYKNVTNEDFSLEFCKKIESICYKRYNKGVLRENIAQLIDKWRGQTFVEYNEDSCWLTRTFERELFRTILGHNSIKTFRYSSFNSFARILTDHSVGMCSIINMNDKTEKDYANDYIKKGLDDAKINKLNIPYANNTENALNCFIMSCSEGNDDLNMWRLYGDDAKGVMLDLKYSPLEEQKESYFFANVSYANKDGKHDELDYLLSLLNCVFFGRSFVLKEWYVWQHFFKPYDYRIEHEVRFLCFLDEIDESLYSNKKKWVLDSKTNILFPLLLLPLINSNVTPQDNMDGKKKILFPFKIERVILGCKMKESKQNVDIIKTFFNNTDKNEVLVDESKIDSYR